MPNPHWKIGTGKLGNKLFGGYEISGTLVAQTGKPIDVESAAGATFYGTDTSRAQYAPGKSYVDSALSGRAENRLKAYFNTSAFVAAGTLYGNVGRNTLRGPAQRNVDLSVGKSLNFADGIKSQFRVQAFNVFNYANFANPGNDVGSSASFGVISSTTGNPRILQLALRVEF